MEKIELYTEEQVRQAMQKAMIPSIYRQDLWGQLTPIELPSDDDICNKAEEIAHNYFDMHNTNHYQGLEEGAKRMAKWILEQIKEQADGIK